MRAFFKAWRWRSFYVYLYNNLHRPMESGKAELRHEICYRVYSDVPGMRDSAMDFLRLMSLTGKGDLIDVCT